MADKLDRLREAWGGRYNVQRELGHGGMATVYLAHDLKHDRAVALKVLRPDLAAALGPERFLREITLTARLDHPHILPLLDSGEADGLLYYVMPYVQGESLRDRLNREKQLPLDDALQIGREVADALSYAHNQGIIHRDIKPENILLAGRHARVADFGIARAVTAARGETLTETGLALGTVAYMSPEQASGQREVDARSDVYSLGCVVFEMLVGEPPFTGPTPEVVLARKSVEAVPSVSVARDIVPARVEQAITKALAKVPADRFATALLFAEALERGTAAPTAVPRVAHSHRALRIATAAAAGTIAVLGVGWWVLAGSGASRARAAPEALPGFADIDARTVAVLPCETDSVEAAEAGIVSLGDRWAEELIRKLVRVPGLRPKEWESVRRYRGSGKTAADVGSELRAGSVVRCAVVEDPNTVRLTADLIRVDDMSLLWSETFQRSPGPDAVNDVQSAAVLGLARALGAEVPEEAVRRVARPLTQDTAALRLYRLAQRFFEVGDRPALRRAVVHFDSAIARDSAFVLAYVALARTKIFLGESEARPTREYYPEGGRLLRKAIELDGSVAEARTWLGQYLLDYTHDWEAAEEEHGKAVALNPASSQAHMWYGFHLQQTGRLERAIEEYEEAVALDPVAYLPRLHLARSLALAGRLDQASEANRHGWELYPGYAAFAHNEGIILVLGGQADSAVAIMEGSADPYSWANGPLYALAGRPDLTRQILDSLMVRSETDPVDPLAIAVQHAGLGNAEEARQWLERAYAERSGLLLYAVGRHLWTEPLRGDPGFETLRRRVGFR